MAQKKVEFFKKANVQVNKIIPPITEEESVIYGRDILWNEINEGDQIIDSEMSINITDSNLFWGTGGKPDDLIVKIKNAYNIVVQNLAGDIENKINISDYIFPISMTGGDVLGHASGSDNILEIVEAGDYIVFCGHEEYKVSSYHKINDTWHTEHTNNGGIYSDGSHLIGDIELRGMAAFDGGIIIFGRNSLASCTVDGVWTSSDGTGGTGANIAASDYNTIVGGFLSASIDFNNDLIVTGGNGRVASYNTINGWTNYNGTGAGTGIYSNGLNSTTYTLTTSLVYNNNLIVAGYNGRVASCTAENVWTSYLGVGGSGIYHDNALDASSRILSMTDFDGDLIVAGYSGKIASCTSGGVWTSISGTGGSGVYNNGVVVGTGSIYSMIEFDSNLIIGASNGRLGSYHITNGWTNYDGSGAGTGVYSSGAALSGADLNGIFTYNNILLIGGEEGKLSSHDTLDWKYFDGTGTGTGIYNRYTLETTQEDTVKIIYYDEKIVVFTETVQDDFFDSIKSSRVSYYDILLEQWFSYLSSENLCINFENSKFNETFSCVYDWNGILIVGGTAGGISSFDGFNWKYADGTGTGTGPYDDGTVFPVSTSITDITSYNGTLVVTGKYSSDDTRLLVSSWDGTNWKHSNGTGTGTGVYYDDNTKERFQKIITYNEYLLGFSSSGMSSYNGASWKLYDGTGTGTGPYTNNGFGNTTISGLLEFNSELFVLAGTGEVSSFDGTNWSFYDGTGVGTGPYNNGDVINNDTAVIIYSLENTLFIAGARYHGFYSVDTWYDWDAETPYTYDVGESLSSTIQTAYSSINSIVCVLGKEEVVTIGKNYDGISYSVWKNDNRSYTSNDSFPGAGLVPDTIGKGWTSEITAVCEYGDYIVFAAEYTDSIVYQSIFSYHKINETWHTPYSSNGGVFLENSGIYSPILYVFSGNLIVAGHNGKMASFDGTNWKDADGTGTGTGPYNNGTAIGTSYFYSLVEFNGDLIVAGQSGRIASYHITNGWTNYDGSGAGTGVYNNSTVLSTSSVRKLYEFNSDLVVSGDSGRLGSYHITNGWTNYDGSGAGTGVYNNGTAVLTGLISNMVEYGGDLVISGSSSVASYHITNGWTNYDGSGAGTGVYNSYPGYFNRSLSNFNGFLITVSAYVEVSSWDGTNWKLYDGTGAGTGPYREGYSFVGNGYINPTGGIDSVFTVQLSDQLLLISELGHIGNYSASGFTDMDVISGSGYGIRYEKMPFPTIDEKEENILSLIVFDDKIISFTETNRTSYYRNDNNWVDYTGADNLSSNKGTLIESGSGRYLHMLKSIIFNGDLIIAGSDENKTNSYIASYNKINGWTNYDGGGAGTGIFRTSSDILGNSLIKDVIEFDNDLIISGADGKVESYSITNGWSNYDGTGAGTGIYGNGTGIGTSHIFSSVEFNSRLFVAGGAGRIGSVDASNSWSNYLSGGSSNNGTCIGNNAIFSMVEFDGDLIVAGQSGRIASYHITNGWTNYDGSGAGTGVYDDGSMSVSYDIVLALAFGDSIIFSTINGNIFNYTNGYGWTNYSGDGAGVGVFGSYDFKIYGAFVYGNVLYFYGEEGKILTIDTYSNATNFSSKIIEYN